MPKRAACPCASPARKPARRRGLSGLGLAVPDFLSRPMPRQQSTCYRSKGDALKVFAEHNRHVIEPATRDSSGESYDAINHMQDRRGKRRVFSMEEALWAALPKKQKAGGGYCLPEIDIKLLNQLPAAQREGGFRLPEFAEATGDEDAVRDAEAAYYEGKPKETHRQKFARVAKECHEETGFPACMKRKLKKEWWEE